MPPFSFLAAVHRSRRIHPGDDAVGNLQSIENANHCRQAKAIALFSVTLKQ